MANTRVLGFDYGRKTIGVATGNRITGTAQPLPPISAVGAAPDWSAIRQLVSEWRPGELVVGLPIGPEGEETPMSKRARKFAGQLAHQTALRVEMVDERYTSAAADSLLRENARPGKGHQRQIARHRDSVAAELIIQTYFNDNRPATQLPEPSTG